MDLVFTLEAHTKNTSCLRVQNSIKNLFCCNLWILKEFLNRDWSCISCFELVLQRITNYGNAIDIINYRDIYDMSPLHYASQKPIPDFTVILLQYGACPLLMSRAGFASVHASTVNKEVLFKAITDHTTCSYCKPYLDFKSSCNYIPLFTKTRLDDHSSTYVQLVSKYFDIDERYGNGETWLYHVIKQYIRDYDYSLNMIEELLKSGADIHIIPKSGVALLDLAKDNYLIYELLFEYDTPIKDPNDV